MKALILAAGKGTRLRPLTANCPKPMLPVADIPLLEHVVVALKRHGVTDIAVNLCYKPWAIVHHFGHGCRWGVRIHYSFEETPLGTAGAAKRLEWYFRDTFIVFSGDVYADVDLAGLVAAHRQGGALLTAGLYNAARAAGGVVELDSQSHIVRMTSEPTAAGLACAGIFVVEPELLSRLSPGEPTDLTALMQHMVAAGQAVLGYPITASLVDVDTPAAYYEARALAAARAAATPPSDLSSRIAAPTVHNVFQRFAVTYSE